MTVKYWYVEGTKEFGGYQCEVEDFKQFFKSRKNIVSSIYLELSNGDKWIFYKRNFWKSGLGVKGYWEKVK